MKFKTRLIVAFCIIAILPVVLFAGLSGTFIYAQWKSLTQNYKIESNLSGFTGASVKIVGMMAEQLELHILEEVEKNPERFTDEEYLKGINEYCNRKNSYIVVRVNNVITYNGSPIDSMAVVNAAIDSNTPKNYAFAQQHGQIYSRVEMKLKDGSKGEIYTFTNINETIPEIKSLFTLVLITVFLALMFTGGLMVIWIYRSMMRPVNAMRCATQNIRDGNLDFDMEIRKDEMGQLASDIDELRNRLKVSAEEKVKQDEMNRQLISNISHDLKTPITTIKGYAEGLLDGIARTPEKQEKYLKTIIAKADDMTRLIEELTLYTKIDVNSIPYEFEDINVKDFFDDCEYDYRNELESEGIDFTFSNYVSAKTYIKGDIEQLRRVMNNIISNSVKYMNKKQRWIALRISIKDDNLRVEVEDNGCGMAAEDLPKIFDRFYRTDASRHGPQNGSGIGLAIVKKIVGDHNGKVWATSKENTGTIIHIELPKEEKNE